MTTSSRLVIDGLGRLPQFAHAGIAGDTTFVSGTLGTVEGLTLAEGMAAQTTQTLENMGVILAGAGASWDDVVKVSVFVSDMSLFGTMNEAYGAFFGDVTPPARITVGGCDLALGALVEMECIAHAPTTTTPATSTALPSRRTERVEHDGESLFVEIVGEEHRNKNVPLVLSHGLGGCHAIWFQQVAAFATDRMVVSWDARGFGNSTDRADASGPDVAAGDLLAVCDALGIDHADFVGQSMGGWTVAGAELARPGIARSIVFADTLGGFSTDAISAAMASRPTDTAPADGSTLGVHPAIDPRLAATSPETAHLYQLLGGFGTIDPPTLIGRLLAHTHDADQAAQINCPVLCVVGDSDPLFPPPAVRALADLLPDARTVEIPACGHSPYFEDPDTWNTIVRRFLDTR